MRWSANADFDYGFEGMASVSGSGRLALPLAAFTQAGERADRNRVHTELAALERESLGRDLVYGILDVACRLGYVRAAVPVLAHLEGIARAESANAQSTTAGVDDRTIWAVRLHNAQAESAALAAQLEAHAPESADLLRHGPGFLCRLPAVPPNLSIDGLDAHPSLDVLRLEGIRESQQMSFAENTGGPELSLDGSVRYDLTTAEFHADVRLSALIPFSTTVAQGSVDAGIDPARATLGIRLDSRSAQARGGLEHAIDERVERERANLAYRLASSYGAYRMSSVQDAMIWQELARHANDPLKTCSALCALPAIPNAAGPVLQLYLEALGASYELTRAQLDLMGVLALDPKPWLVESVQSSPGPAMESLARLDSVEIPSVNAGGTVLANRP